MFIGKEAAIFTADHLETTLQDLPDYKMANYEAALIKSFIKMDEMIDAPSGRKKMLDIQKKYPENKS